MRKPQSKAKCHGFIPDPSSRIAEEDIERLLDTPAVDSRLTVYTNFNILVSCPYGKITPATSYIETKLYDCAIMPSRSTYNQLEFSAYSFLGNGYVFNLDYDLSPTLLDAALYLCFKERLKHSEEMPLKIYYADRQGLPVVIDITGKEGVRKYINNANFFYIGPSGNGKSFHMNSVVRQLLEQSTGVVTINTGDSYEGVCNYSGGAYTIYSKDRPISMNPFKITKTEYQQNFGEKKNFPKSLIFPVYRGSGRPSKIEDAIVNQVIVEYYGAFFYPFRGFSTEEKDRL